MSGAARKLDDEAVERKARLAESVSEDWQSGLRESGKGFTGDEHNVLVALTMAPELVGLVRFNEFSLNVEFTRAPPWRLCLPGDPWSDSDDTELAIWLQARGINVTRRSVVAATVMVAARKRHYHPVRDYLNGLVWDGIARLHNWLQKYLGARGREAYLSAIGQRFLVSGVARIFDPGCQVDHVLVLEGPQGIGKTSAARVLAVRPAWFAGNLPDVHSKDAALQLGGRWIVEIAELKAIRNAQQEGVKSFITQCVDTLRPPYGQRTAQYPRQCVFIATTNEREYLRDRSGNRRYWPVQCQTIDLPALIHDRDQLWAEAVHEYRRGMKWHLTEVEELLAMDEQAERVHVTELEADVAVFLKGLRDAGTREVSVRDVLVSGLHLDPDSESFTDRARKLGAAVAEAMERSGWRKVARKNSPEGKRTVYRWPGQGGQD